MLFSIIIPVYNVEKYLRESIDSVLLQDEKDMEVILVDDGSTDSSSKICDEYQTCFPGIIRVVHKANEGLLLTRRCGIREAKGRWLIHLDSDDYMMPGVLKSIHETIDKYNPDLIIGKIAYGAEDGKSIDYYSRLSFCNGQVFENENKETLYKQFFLDGYLNAIYQKIARNDIVDVEADYSQWTRVSMAEDVLQSLPLLYNSKRCIFIDKVFVYYRYNTESITKKKSAASHIKNIFSVLDVIGEEKRYYELMNISDSIISDIATKQCRQLCNQIRQMCRCGKEKGIKESIKELNKNDVWQWLFLNANSVKLGRFSKVCHALILKELIGLLVLFCQTF